MKKLILLSYLVFVALLLTGCTSAEEKEAKEKCFQQMKTNYARINDDTITSCVANYSVKVNYVSYQYCINTNGDIYDGTRKISKGDYDYERVSTWYSQIKDEVTNRVEDHYAFEFKSSELK